MCPSQSKDSVEGRRVVTRAFIKVPQSVHGSRGIPSLAPSVDVALELCGETVFIKVRKSLKEGLTELKRALVIQDDDDDDDSPL